MSEEDSTDLAARLRDRITRRGPISFRDWMDAALYDERDGYYSRANPSHTPWGRRGDYRTSPTTSQLFGATFARYFADLYARLGSPDEFTIVEVGAGAGDFARHALDALRRERRAVYDATNYTVDEISPSARELVAARVAPHRVKFSRIADDAETIECGVVFANELLDAMPAHRVRWRRKEQLGCESGAATAASLVEDFVDVEEGEFVFVEREPSTARLAERAARMAGASTAAGQTFEINFAAEDWLKSVARKLSRGFVVLVDYGAEEAELLDPHLRFDGTLRSFERHRLTADVLKSPGQRDITAHVNWTRLKSVCESENLRVVAFEKQDKFLLAAGALEELAALTAPSDNAAAAALAVSAREMLLPDKMGANFQVLVCEKIG